MDKLIELLQQIQELAGVGVDALKGASKGDGEKGGPPHEGGGPAGPPHGGPAEEAAEGEPPVKR